MIVGHYFVMIYCISLYVFNINSIKLNIVQALRKVFLLSLQILDVIYILLFVDHKELVY